MKEFFLNLLSGAIENIGETKLEEILQKLHDKNLDQYKAAIYGGNALVKSLQGFVEGTQTKIDDAILSAIGDAVRDSAELNGIDLTVPVSLQPVTV